MTHENNWYYNKRMNILAFLFEWKFPKSKEVKKIKHHKPKRQNKIGMSGLVEGVQKPDKLFFFKRYGDLRIKLCRFIFTLNVSEFLMPRMKKRDIKYESVQDTKSGSQSIEYEKKIPRNDNLLSLCVCVCIYKRGCVRK